MKSSWIDAQAYLSLPQVWTYSEGRVKRVGNKWSRRTHRKQAAIDRHNTRRWVKTAAEGIEENGDGGDVKRSLIDLGFKCVLCFVGDPCSRCKVQGSRRTREKEKRREKRRKGRNDLQARRPPISPTKLITSLSTLCCTDQSSSEGR